MARFTRSSGEILYKPIPFYCNEHKQYTCKGYCKKCKDVTKQRIAINAYKKYYGPIHNFNYRCTKKVFSNGKLIDIKILRDIKNRIMNRCLKSIGRKRENYTERILRLFNPHLKEVLDEIFNN